MPIMRGNGVVDGVVDGGAEDGVEDGEIFKVLDELDLAYERRTSTRGVPYAGLRLTGVADVAVTVIAEHKVLRLTAHAIDTPLGALDIVKASARLPLGAAFRSPDDGTAQFSVGVWIGDAPLASDLLSRLLSYLLAATDALRRGTAAPPLPYVGDVTARSVVDFDAALGPYGHRLTKARDGAALRVSLAPDLDCAIVLREPADGWVSASATYVPPQSVVMTEASIAEMQRLQRWATAGRFVFDDSLTLGADVMTPLVGRTPAPAIVWTTSQSVALLQAAARFLGFIARDGEPR